MCDVISRSTLYCRSASPSSSVLSLPDGGDSKADYQDEVGEDADGDASSRIRRAITGNISPVCGKVYKFNRSQKLAAVRTHNRMRRREGASDMIRLVSYAFNARLLLLAPAELNAASSARENNHSIFCRVN